MTLTPDSLAQLRKDLIRDEGLRLTAYQDSVGLWTIGVGHLLGKTPRMSELTPRECDVLFAADVEEAQAILSRYVTAPLLSEARHRALVNMAFNLGPRLGEFKKFIAAVNAGDWATAAAEMQDSAWWGQVGARAARLRDAIMEGGE